MREIDPRVERLVRECIGRIRGRFLYTEEEALEAMGLVLKKPVPRKNNGYIATADSAPRKPWKPGDPKPERQESA